jgi:xanthine dehydrogenase accessory factor
VVSVATPAGEVSVFLEVFPRPRTLLVIGGGHLSEVLVRLARPLGYRTVVADPREPFLARERFPEADELLPVWPAEAFTTAGVDEATAVCVLSHDPKFDEPALELALRSRAGYIGAIGSRKTQAERRAKLVAAGFTEAEVARIHGPIGLDLGGRQPAEIALAILGEITKARYGKRKQ